MMRSRSYHDLDFLFLRMSPCLYELADSRFAPSSYTGQLQKQHCGLSRREILHVERTKLNPSHRSYIQLVVRSKLVSAAV